MFHMKEQNKAPEKELNSHLSYADLKTLIIRMLKELKGRVDELRENFNRYKT